MECRHVLSGLLGVVTLTLFVVCSVRLHSLTEEASYIVSTNANYSVVVTSDNVKAVCVGDCDYATLPTTVQGSKPLLIYRGDIYLTPTTRLRVSESGFQLLKADNTTLLQGDVANGTAYYTVPPSVFQVGEFAVDGSLPLPEMVTILTVTLPDPNNKIIRGVCIVTDTRYNNAICYMEAGPVIKSMYLSLDRIWGAWGTEYVSSLTQTTAVPYVIECVTSAVAPPGYINIVFTVYGAQLGVVDKSTLVSTLSYSIYSAKCISTDGMTELFPAAYVCFKGSQCSPTMTYWLSDTGIATEQAPDLLYIVPGAQGTIFISCSEGYTS